MGRTEKLDLSVIFKKNVQTCLIPASKLRTDNREIGEFLLTFKMGAFHSWCFLVGQNNYRDVNAEMIKLTAAGQVVCIEQQRRRTVASVSSRRVAARVGAATILQFTFINV